MKLRTALIVSGLVLLAAGFTATQQPKPWPVPDKAAKTANPVKSNQESIAAGKSLWGQHCGSCHGKTGKGDGNKAAQLKTPLVDFATTDYQSQTDGTLFYKTEEGRDEMPSFKKKIPDDEERWSLVNYIRTIK